PEMMHVPNLAPLTMAEVLDNILKDCRAWCIELDLLRHVCGNPSPPLGSTAVQCGCVEIVLDSRFLVGVDLAPEIELCFDSVSFKLNSNNLLLFVHGHLC